MIETQSEKLIVSIKPFIYFTNVGRPKPASDVVILSLYQFQIDLCMKLLSGCECLMYGTSDCRQELRVCCDTFFDLLKKTEIPECLSVLKSDDMIDECIDIMYCYGILTNTHFGNPLHRDGTSSSFRIECDNRRKSGDRDSPDKILEKLWTRTDRIIFEWPVIFFNQNLILYIVQSYLLLFAEHHNGITKVVADSTCSNDRDNTAKCAGNICQENADNLIDNLRSSSHKARQNTFIDYGELIGELHNRLTEIEENHDKSPPTLEEYFENRTTDSVVTLKLYCDPETMNISEMHCIKSVLT